MTLQKDPNIPPEAGSRQASLVALQIFFVLVALSVYGLRVYTRTVILRSISNDDYIMGLAMFVSIGLSINACVSTMYGWGTHLSAIPEANIGALLLSIWISELLFTITTSLAKISILFFYLRIAVTKTYRQVIYGSIAFITIWTIAFGAIIIFQCQPVSNYWNPNSAKCYNPEVPLFIHGLTNTMTDIYIYILPMKMVWGLQLPRRQRMGIIAIFGAGFLVCVAGAIRLYYSILTTKSSDTPWEGFNLWTWETIEIDLGIVCASAPSLKALVARTFPKLFQSQTGNSNSRVYALGSLQPNSKRVKHIRGGDDSQDELTDVHEHVLIAKVGYNQMA